ncbi:MULTISPECIES: hypothetical protein [Leclercia]|uniref:hypothetical protein n=1 Tax=Leclercia TaxID=83654 RepID=UPI0018D25A02|nr:MULTISPECIES: hypothetical protein [Leclercia]URM20856.1 hypothetical protein JJN11_11835 [Leclercia adecarboxylata]
MINSPAPRLTRLGEQPHDITHADRSFVGRVRRSRHPAVLRRAALRLPGLQTVVNSPAPRLIRLGEHPHDITHADRSFVGRVRRSRHPALLRRAALRLPGLQTVVNSPAPRLTRLGEQPHDITHADRRALQILLV